MGAETQIAMELPRWREVEDAVEGIVQEYYGADEADARVVDEGPEQFAIDVTYDGDLIKDPRAFTEEEDGAVVLATLTEPIGESRVRVIYKRITGETARNDRSAALPIGVLVDRYDLYPTDHDRVWTRHEDDDQRLIDVGKTIADEFPEVRVLVSESSQPEEDSTWGYMGAFNLVTVRDTPSRSEMRPEQIIQEFRAQFR